MGTKIIISIDGGGIRGVLPLLILQEIQRATSTDLFELETEWWGTSTGALISAAVNAQRGSGSFEQAVSNVLDLYEFRSAKAVRPPGKQSLPSRALNQLIRANFSHVPLRALSNLHLIATDAETLNPVTFDATSNANLADVVMASCAFPGLFPAVEIDGREYIDGYLHAKNPTRFAIDANDPEVLTLVISLGTGDFGLTDKVEEKVDADHHYVKKQLEESGVAYYRFNPKLELASPEMQDVRPKNIANLRKDTLNYIMKIREDIAAIAAQIQTIR